MAERKNVLTIAGKAVRLKERLPLKDGARLPALAQKAGSGDLLDLVPVCAMLIDTWEFPGDPSDEDSYGELDIFTEVTPLVRAVSEYIQERLSTNPKAQ